MAPWLPRLGNEPRTGRFHFLSYLRRRAPALCRGSFILCSQPCKTTLSPTWALKLLPVPGPVDLGIAACGGVIAILATNAGRRVLSLPVDQPREAGRLGAGPLFSCRGKISARYPGQARTRPASLWKDPIKEPIERSRRLRVSRFQGQGDGFAGISRDGHRAAFEAVLAPHGVAIRRQAGL